MLLRIATHVRVTRVLYVARDRRMGGVTDLRVAHDGRVYVPEPPPKLSLVGDEACPTELTRLTVRGVVAVVTPSALSNGRKPSAPPAQGHYRAVTWAS